MPPSIRLNLIVIRVAELERARHFYELLGLKFIRHRHGQGPEHLSAEIGDAVFELYPQSSQAASTQGVRLGFAVTDLEKVITTLQPESILLPPQDSPWGKRAVVTDLDGHKIELTAV